MKVLVSDKLSESGVQVLKAGGLEVDVKTKLSPSELSSVIKDYEGLIVRSATQVTKEMIEKADQLKVVGRAGSGLDNIDVSAATQRGIVVMNTPGGNTVTTAEHTMAMIFSVARSIPQAHASVKSGKWEKSKFMGIELYNKCLGIIGVGQIGSYVARLARGAQMRVIGYDPFLSPEGADRMGIKLASLDELFHQADIITIHTPLTPETRSLINADSINKMKDGVRIVNCARGGVIDEQDLFRSMTLGKVAGAAMDVFEKEPLDPESPLLTLHNFIGTPHIGAATTEAQERVATAIADQIVDYLKNGVVRGAVNIPSIPLEMLPKIQPLLDLAERLGSFLAQSFEGRLERLSIECRGEILESAVSFITIAAIKGLLGPILEEPVNFVNAAVKAKERGIEISETKNQESGEFTSLIVLRVSGGGREGTVSGTLYDRRDPRIVEIDALPLEVVPEGHMLLLKNDDKPGVIGGIGTLLGNNHINISRMQLGRNQPAQKAISVVSVDAPLSADLLAQIRKLEHILSAKQIKL